MDRRLHLRADLVGDGVRRVRLRRVLPPDRGVAPPSPDAYRATARRVGDGAVGSQPSRPRRLRGDPSRRCWLSIHRHPLPPTPLRGRALASIGSVGDSYDNSMAESVIGLYKTECIKLDGSFKTVDEVELATLMRVDWYNTGRLRSAIDYLPPTEYEQAYYDQLNTPQDQSVLGELTLH